MTNKPLNKKTLIATLITCLVVDGSLLIFCVWIADGVGKGLYYFLLGGGPPTIIVSQPLYAWFAAR